jgi:sialic acid synthase SpsE
MVRFGQREVGDGAPCFITFEAGATHDGLASAKRLVTRAAEAGADAVKFQICDPDRLVADREQPFSYEVLVDRESGATETVTEPLYELLRRRALSRDEWRELKRHSESLGLAFFATVAFEDEIDLLVELGCDSIKIASADVNHLPLIGQAAATGMCLQVDTGNATIGEIETAVDVIRSEGNENIIIHHCPSGYPARLESINLNVIPTLKRMFPYPTAYSDHTPGWEMDIAAVVLGANLVEKTITEDRMTRSIEHIMSLEPTEMSAFVGAIRDLEIAMGGPRRILHPAEKGRRLKIRRSVHLAEPARKGQRLRDVAVEFRRPGDGIPPDEYEAYLDATFREDLPAGHRVSRHELLPLSRS